MNPVGVEVAGHRRGTASIRVLATVAVVVAVLPLVSLVVWSVSQAWPYPSLRPMTTTSRGLRLLVAPRTGALHALVLSTGIGAAVAALAVLVGLPAGRAVGLYRFRGRRLVQFALLAPVIVPGLAVTLGLQVFFVRYGLSGTVPGVILVQLVPTVPYAATVLGAGFANLDVDHERVARTLGAGPVRTTWSVTLPLMRPSIVAAALFCFLISWSEYVLTLLVGAGHVQTLPLQLYSAIGGTDMTLAAALALLVIVPPLLAVAACSRVLSGGSGAGMGLGRL